jgi:CheY-like chemotaxis protein
LRDEGETALIEVRDTGRGIPASFMPHLFSRFRQGEGGTTRSEGGLGLGLAIARHLVEMHGGSIWAESAGEGRGSRFALRLPRKPELHAPSAPPPPRAEPEEQRAIETAPSLAGLQVLVVEDDDDSRELIGFILESHGARVELVASASAALKAIAGARFDALLSDVSMPGEDGYSLVRKLRASQQSALPAAALTANVRPEDRDRALQAGFQLHIGKPVEPVELVRAVFQLAHPA